LKCQAFGRDGAAPAAVFSKRTLHEQNVAAFSSDAALEKIAVAQKSSPTRLESVPLIAS
jgi:hypothetical protein